MHPTELWVLSTSLSEGVLLLVSVLGLVASSLQAGTCLFSLSILAPLLLSSNKASGQSATAVNVK